MKNPAIVALLTAVLVSPSLADPAVRINGVIDSILGEDAFVSAPAVAVANRASSTEVSESLAKAIKLRQTIRQLAFENGRRVTKELIAQANGQFSGSWLFGFGSMGGDFSAEAYKPMLEGGESFIIPMPSQEALGLFDAMRTEWSKKNIAQCTSPQTIIAVVGGHERLAAIEILKANLRQLQDVLDRLEAQTQSAGATSQQVDKYNELRKWAQNSQISLAIFTPREWSIGSPQDNSRKGCQYEYMQDSFNFKDFHVNFKINRGDDGIGDYVYRPFFCNGGIDWAMTKAFTFTTTSELRVY
jgi:hypothetical protein